MYESLKLFHIGAAAASISGFSLRVYWMMTSSAWLGHRWVKVLPHVVDTLFLASGIGLLFVLHLSLVQSVWLLAKLTALAIYVALGSIALRHGKTIRARTTAAALALATYVYIVGVALSKSADSWLAWAAR